MLCTSRICTRFPNLPLNVLLQMSQVVLVNMAFSCCVVFSSRISLGRKYSLLYNLALIEASDWSAILDCVRVQILEVSGPGVSGLLGLTGCAGMITVSDTCILRSTSQAPSERRHKGLCTTPSTRDTPGLLS